MFDVFFTNIYSFYKKNYYDSLNKKSKDLSLQEVFSLDIINALNHPSIIQFAKYLHISQPNATYKVNQLCEKGYVKKIHSKADKRIYYLEVTKKYNDEYKINDAYIKESIQTIKDTLTDQELQTFTDLLSKVDQALNKN